MSTSFKYGVLLAALLLSSIAVSCARGRQPQTQSVGPAAASADNYPSLAAKTKEITDAFAGKDYEKVLELTYPKVIETAGGRDKMLATMQKEIREMETEGVAVLSVVPGSPTNFVHDTGSIYAVVPITMKMRAQDGIFQTEGTLIGISADGGANWTFIDAAGEDDKDLKLLSPGVLDKLKVPPEKPPVKLGS